MIIYSCAPIISGMSEKMKPQCPLGHGDCPPNCPNHEAAKKITESQGKKFNPFISRVGVVFGDAFDPRVKLRHVAAVMAKCVKEKEVSTPILTAGILIIKENKVLLVENLEGSGHKAGIFGLPAGRVEQGESEVEAAIRELKEETGLVTSAENLVRLPTTYETDVPRKDGIPKRFKGICFKCLDYSGELKGSSETQPVWVEISKLDEMNLLPNVKNAVMEGLEDK